MIITKVLGNTATAEGAKIATSRHVETLNLDGPALLKRIQRLTTDHGTEIGIRLSPSAPLLHDGDIVHFDEANAIVVKVMPTDVLVIAPPTIVSMAFVAHSLGNRHLPAQFFGEDSEYGTECMVVQYDHTVEEFLEHHSIPYSRQERVVPEPFRHAEHSH